MALNPKKMGYYIDLKKISIRRLPGNSPINGSATQLEDTRKGYCLLNLEKMEPLAGIQNLEELLTALKTKKKLQEFSVSCEVPLDYLTVLRRVVNGYLPKPNRFRDFPGLDPAIIEQMESNGIKNTFQLYNQVLSPEQRNHLSNHTGISPEEIEKLARLTDLSRIKWVNHTFAYVLYETGFRSAKAIAEADYMDIYDKVKALNEERKIYKGHIGANDMKRCVDSAKGLEFEIVF